MSPIVTSPSERPSKEERKEDAMVYSKISDLALTGLIPEKGRGIPEDYKVEGKAKPATLSYLYYSDCGGMTKL